MGTIGRDRGKLGNRELKSASFRRQTVVMCVAVLLAAAAAAVLASVPASSSESPVHPPIAPVALLDAGPFYCDMVTHLAAKPYVEQRSDLLRGETQLRLFTIGVPAEEIRTAFRCACVRRKFDPARAQPHPPAALLAVWSCSPDVEILEFGPTDAWGAAWGAPQWEEFGTRVSGHAAWGAVLPISSRLGRWIGGWHFGASWLPVASDVPFAVLLHHSRAGLTAAEFARVTSSPSKRVHLTWAPDAAATATDVRRAMLRLAIAERDRRAYRRGESACQDRLQAECRAQLQAAQNALAIRQARAPEILDAIAHNRLPCAAVPCAPCVPCLPDYPPAPHASSDGPGEAWRAALVCPLTMGPLQDPTLNVRSGHTYSGQEIRQWVRDHATDPITRAPTALQDLVPNRLARDLLDLA
jgi:hypothetical protein